MSQGTVCDRCHCGIFGEVFPLTFPRGTEADLCKKCYDKFVRFMAGAEVPEPPRKEIMTGRG